jgi:hypothetical protein
MSVDKQELLSTPASMRLSQRMLLLQAAVRYLRASGPR